MSISAGNSIKEWPTENFVALAQHVIEKHRAFVVLIGAPGEKDRLLNVKKLIPGNVVVASDFLLEELPSLMKRFQLFVAADTGPIHVAHALGIPLIDIIGPVDPSEQAPRNDPKSMVLTPPPPLTPSIFAFRPAGSPQESRRAAQAITVGQVAVTLDTFIEKIRQGKW